MPVRKRSRSGPQQLWTIQHFDRFGNLVSTSSGLNKAFTEECTDYTGNFGGNNPFDHSLLKYPGGHIHGTVVDDQGVVRSIYTNCGIVQTNATHQHLSLPHLAIPSFATLGSRMSPNRPKVDLPVFLFELKDLPGMAKQVQSFGKSLPTAIRLIQQAGNQLSSKRKGRMPSTKNVAGTLGNIHLSYQFGWSPLISDLYKLTDFGEAVERRTKQINNLFGKKGLRRRIDIGAVSSSEDSGYTLLNSSGFVARGHIVTKTTGRRWASSRWFPAPGTMPPSPKDMDWAVMRSLLGLSLDPATLWQMIPFSWLVDWAVPIGDYLDNYRNSIPARVERISSMYERKTIVEYKVMALSNGFAGNGGQFVRRTQSRSTGTPSIQPGEFPYLELPQVSILASLSVAKQNAWKLSRR